MGPGAVLDAGMLDVFVSLVVSLVWFGLVFFRVLASLASLLSAG